MAAHDSRPFEVAVHCRSWDGLVCADKMRLAAVLLPVLDGPQRRRLGRGSPKSVASAPLTEKARQILSQRF